jgi:hypothetical protein
MMSRVLHVSIALALVALVVAILLWGLRARRTRRLALLGLVPAGAALGAFLWSWLHPEAELVLRIAMGLAAVALGLAHAVAASLVALPPRRVWMRMTFVPVGLWAGTLAGLWLVMPVPGAVLEVCFGALAAIAVGGWIALAIGGRERGYVVRDGKRNASVRFPCPRCGTRVDWSCGVGACTDCGLFVHLLWPADELQAQHARADAPARPVHDRHVRFACPQCSRVASWPSGDGACAGCGLKLSLHWNAHVKTARLEPAAEPPRSRAD